MTEVRDKPAVMLLAHRIPYPPNKGDKIRSFHLLQYLRKHYRVLLGCFIDDPQDHQYQSLLEAQCAASCFITLNPTWRKLVSLRGFITGAPLTLPFYANSQMQKWVDQNIQKHDVKRVIAFSSATAQFVDKDWGGNVRRVMDFIDIDSDKWMQYAESKAFPMRQIYRRESRRLLAYEQRIAARFEASSFVSEQESTLFKRLAPRSSDKIHTISNGVDLQQFAPELAFKSPFNRMKSDRHLVFVGAMDYWPNEEAVCWFADEVMPLFNGKVAMHFWIVGSNPTPAVQKLAQRDNISVTGRVEDVRDYVASADVVVAPLRIARGIQNKVLEALAMGKPVVVTPAALEGIPALPERDLLLAEEARGLADQILRVIEHPALAEELGKAGRRCVERHFSWEDNLSLFNELLEAGPDNTGCRVAN